MTRLTKIFLFLSVVIASWNFMFFMHINTIAPGLSEKYFSISMGLIYFIAPLMLLMVIFVIKEFKKVKYVFVYPSFLFFVTIFIKPFEVVKDDGSWSYNISSWFHTLIHLNWIYIMLVIVLCLYVIFKSRDLLKRERAKFIFYGLMTALAGEIILVTLIDYHPETSSFTALLFSTMTLFMGYSASLTREKVGDVQTTDESYFGLAKYYVLFLSRFKKDLEANDLSEEDVSYDDLIRDMGLEEFDPDKNGFVFLGQNTFEYEKMKRYPGEILDVVEDIDRMDDSLDELRSILLYTYNMIKEKSEEEALEWFIEMFSTYGNFLYEKRLIDDIPIPFITVYQDGRVERFNDAFEDLFNILGEGRDLEELKKNGICEIAACKDSENMFRKISSAIDESGPKDSKFSIGSRAIGKIVVNVVSIPDKGSHTDENGCKYILFFEKRE